MSAGMPVADVLSAEVHRRYQRISSSDSSLVGSTLCGACYVCGNYREQIFGKCLNAGTKSKHGKVVLCQDCRIHTLNLEE